MEILAVIIIGLAVATTGVINPKNKDVDDLAKAPQTEVTTPIVQEIKPEPEPEPEPQVAKEPDPEPQVAKEPDPEPQVAKEPEPEAQPEEPKEEVNTETVQEQDAKPEDEVATVAQEEIVDINEDKGISMLNIIFYIIGAIAALAAGIYFFMRKEPDQSAADIARSQSRESTPELQEEQPAQEETYSDPETEQPAQEETQTEPTETEENSTSENTNDQSSNNDDENNNR
jgi:hypothetical protein